MEKYVWIALTVTARKPLAHDSSHISVNLLVVVSDLCMRVVGT